MTTTAQLDALRREVEHIAAAGAPHSTRAGTQSVKKKTLAFSA
jgi:hypothetical protein